MPTIKFILQSKNEASNIYLRFTASRSENFKRKTGLTINPKEWSVSKAEPLQKSTETKELKITLDKLKLFINNAYNESVSKGDVINGQWLQLNIDKFNNKAPVNNLDILTNSIKKFISEAPYKQNQKGGTGLSDGRIKNLKLFCNTISRYEQENFNGKSILVRDVNLKFVENFKKWLFNQSYSINYVGKNITNLKTICTDASNNEIETSSQFKNIKTISEKKAPESIVYLTEQEQLQIKDAKLKRDALVNARKWLLLGCQLGQRGGDLLNITANNIKEITGIKIIELQQQKTGKLVAIPLFPEAEEIIEDGMPYKISLPRFNEYIKDICKIAKINTTMTGRIKESNKQATSVKTLPKWRFITSHVCRRSFASNFYAKYPTPLLMNITAHGSEQMFLKYIGKTTYDNAYQMLEYFSKINQNKSPQLEVIHKNIGNK
jgi:integrase